ncbi:MAG TPA: alpha/beta hydrolase [Solirubrobacterales bacterium]|nr:alpha/beta hydrolase [Solirubrobacterales bacterium]
MSPAIRLGGERAAIDHAAPTSPPARLRREEVTVGRVATRSVVADGDGVPAVLLHGWMDNADTWLAVLERLAVAGRPGVAYDLPGFGTAPPLGEGSVVDQLAEFAAAAVERAAERHGGQVVVAGNSLGGWAALRLAERDDLPLAGVVPIGPAGIRMAPFFFTADRIPAVSRVIGLPAPVPPAVVRSVMARFYRTLAYAEPSSVDQAVVDRFTKHNTDRAILRERIDYAKRLRAELARPFDPAKIRVPVTVLWGDTDRLCMPAGAEELARMLPDARIEMLEGVGHTPQIEVPDVVVAAIEDLAGDGTRRRSSQ